MRSGLIIFLQILLTLPAFVSCFTEEEITSGQTDIITVGQQLPDFSVRMNDCTQVSPSSLSGKPAVIVFFIPAVRTVEKNCPLYSVCMTSVLRWLHSFASAGRKTRRLLLLIGRRKSCRCPIRHSRTRPYTRNSRGRPFPVSM